MKEADYSRLSAEAEELVAHGQFVTAKPVCKQLCNANPGRAKGWLLLGKVCQETAAFDEALECAQRALALQPQLIEAHIVKGYAHLGKHQLARAFESFQAASRLSPANTDAYIGMGATYHSDNYFREALSCYSKALEYQPKSLPAHYNSGLIHSLLGEHEQALECFREAHSICPSQPEPLVAQADTHEKMGAFDAAADLLVPLIRTGVANIQAGVVYARICKHVNQCADAIRYLELIDATKPLNKEEKSSLHFTLGKLYEGTGTYDTAFEHYQVGNRAHGANYDPRADTRYFDTFISTCSRKMMESAPAPLTDSRLPIFIIGMPRSGTSLVENIIASHPDVSGGGEMREIINITDALDKTLGSAHPYPACMNELTPQAVNTLSLDYLSALRKISGSSLRVTDKMPHNFLHLPLIRILFPTAPIIHCTRNPLDACLSCYFQSFAGNALPYSYDLSFMGQHYRHYLRLMDHWKNNLGISMLDVSYEELVGNQERVSRRIIQHCDLEWADDCLQFHKAKHITRTASYDQVRKPLYSTSVGRWKHYEKHLTPLKTALGMPA